MSKSVVLIGYPLKHSISPVFQQSAFDHHGLDVKYEKWETQLEQLPATVDRVRHPSMLGANVTIPCKEKVIPMLDELNDAALQIGAVNTIVNKGGKLIGHNTDVLGFIKALRQDADYRLRNRKVVLLGAGGLARAVVFALVKEEARSVAVFNRSLERGTRLVTSFARRAGRTGLSALPWAELQGSVALQDCDLLVNCTSVGMRYSATETKSPLRADLIPKDALVCDLVYNPEETPFLNEAKKAGARTLGGLSMLVYQGAASFELWTGKTAPVDIMLQSAREVLS